MQITVKSQFIQQMESRVLVIDGAMGTSIYSYDLNLNRDYLGCENCPEVITETRPEIIEEIHESFLKVGADCVETNTFGANKIVLAEFDRAHETYRYNLDAARAARRAADRFSTKDKPRFVLGSIGPGTKLPSLGNTTFDILEDSYAEQCRGLIDGGADALIIETCQDLLQIKSAISGATLAMQEKSRELPIICQVTIELNGAMLVGTDIAAALVALEAYPQVKVIGMNCATGPQEMAEHVRYLCRNSSRYISVVPNAGLPQLVEGRTHYALTPDEIAKWAREFVVTDGVNIVGGCCGTTPAHIAAIHEAVRDLKPRARIPARQPSVSSLYQAVTLRQDNSFLIVGERSNTNGSKKFRELLLAGDIDGLVEVGREQAREGAHVLDVCVDYVGRDGVPDMQAVVTRYVKDVTVPLMLDSTEAPVLEAGLKLAGGKCIVNSVNLEDGEEKMEKVCPMLRKYGAAVVALTIDEDPQEAMAKTAERKLLIATRIHQLLTVKYGIPEEDILFDCLTFPVTTGNEADRRLALETLDGIEAIMEKFPRCGSILGVSNVSFGLLPAARAVLNSVFLHEATQRGLTAAIVHASKILPRNKISDERWDAALDLIYDRRREGFDPLQHFIGLFDKGEKVGERKIAADLPVEERLKQRIIDGERIGIDKDLDAAMKQYKPLEIINNILLDGMKVVGDLFGTGKMQLPFVLSSAETMKTAVAYLEPHMERVEGDSKGKIVLATVKGDVHDIGKNLVDIILTNNGYTVHNLGIKQPINDIITAYQKHNADAIGLSGLLVKSTLVMRDDLLVLNERGLRVPVILGGAALTRGYVENDLRLQYEGDVAYAKDAFEGLALMNRLAEGKPLVDTAAAKAATRSRVDLQASKGERPILELPARSAVSTSIPIPTPPFWGSRVIQKIELKTILPYINEKMLFGVQWEYKPGGRKREEYEAYIKNEIRPILFDLARQCANENILLPQAVYGYWPCNSEGNDLIIYEPPEMSAANGDSRPAGAPPIDASRFSRRELLRFSFPRQDNPPYWCLADFYRPMESGEIDVVAFHLVTVGRAASDVARNWFAQNRYRDYLHLHGLGVEAAEALAEYMHKQIRMELGIAQQDAMEVRRLFQQGYQGSRYSFGYPACPNLEDQAKLWPLLNPERIGVTLSDEFQLDPEQSTSAIIAHHPEARYFNVRSKTDGQLEMRLGQAE
ncbi:MAG: methionine synthase [Phycisphaerae bacterium]|nr:methionine synthase [Phycisphaerae bacterium]